MFAGVLSRKWACFFHQFPLKSLSSISQLQGCWSTANLHCTKKNKNNMRVKFLLTCGHRHLFDGLELLFSTDGVACTLGLDHSQHLPCSWHCTRGRILSWDQTCPVECGNCCKNLMNLVQYNELHLPDLVKPSKLLLLRGL